MMQNTSISERILQLIESLQITPNVFAKKIGYSRSQAVYDMISGKSKPSFDFFDKLFSSEFGDLINPKWLLTGKGLMYITDIPVFSEPGSSYDQTVHKLSNARSIEDIDDVTRLTNKNGIDFLIYPNEEIKVEVIEIPFPAYASYIEAYNDEDKLHQEFAKATFSVDKLGRGYYLGFRVTGDSMNGGGLNDTPDGAQVLGRELLRHHWQDGFRKNDYGFILMTKQAIYHKDITKYDTENGTLTLSSRNKKQKDFQISINDVFRIFKVIKRTF